MGEKTYCGRSRRAGCVEERMEQREAVLEGGEHLSPPRER